jgi:L-lysine exporter family protein LysE/ArgO
MLSAFLTGFFLGLSLIVAIGAQNTFVLRQGILGQHVFYIALFCALSDTLLICIGVAGISFFFHNLIYQNLNILFGFSALWLTTYGILRLRSAFKSNKTIDIKTSMSKNLLTTLSVAAALTFLNPHVYLDTMILIGSISQQFSGLYKITFAFGASLASFIFFFSLAYGSRLLMPIMQNPFSWKILDMLVAFIMFVIAIKLVHLGNWL